jgi:hypothetical protein
MSLVLQIEPGVTQHDLGQLDALEIRFFAFSHSLRQSAINPTAIRQRFKHGCHCHFNTF